MGQQESHAPYDDQRQLVEHIDNKHGSDIMRLFCQFPIIDWNIMHNLNLIID